MRRLPKTAALTAVALCLVTANGCHGPVAEPSPPGRAPTGTSTYSLDGDRSYRLYVPAGVATPAPLVLMLHGGFGTAQHAQEHYGWVDAADAHRFVVAFPEGLDRAWNVGGGCCGHPGRTGADDVGFIAEVVADVSRRVTVDSDRVYATGMSNGAMLSYRLACDLDIFAAIAPVAGTLLGECPAPRPLSVLHIHGLGDTNVRFDGEPGAGVSGIDGPPVPSVVDTWRAVDACGPPSTYLDGVVTTVRYECPQGMEVALVTIAGAGHQWPGSDAGRPGADPPSTAVDATVLIWSFFAAHPRR